MLAVNNGPSLIIFVSLFFVSFQFLVRLHLFNENSTKYRQELGEKTRRAVSGLFILLCTVLTISFLTG